MGEEHTMNPIELFGDNCMSQTPTSNKDTLLLEVFHGLAEGRHNVQRPFADPRYSEWVVQWMTLSRGSLPREPLPYIGN